MGAITIVDIDYLVLVNKNNKLPDNWEDIVELESAKDAWNEEIKVEKETLRKYYELKKDLLKENINIELDSVYRSVDEQRKIWKAYEEEYGIDYVKKYVAVPEYSEHHTGLAIDVCLKIDGKLVYENYEIMNEKKIFSKIHKKLANYGFILRYPHNKERITGYGYEPWHFRYLGDSKIAHVIMDNNLTLEEYKMKK